MCPRKKFTRIEQLQVTLSLGISGRLLGLTCPTRRRRTLWGVRNSSVLGRHILGLHGLLSIGNGRGVELGLLDGLVPNPVVAAVGGNDAEANEGPKVAKHCKENR